VSKDWIVRPTTRAYRGYTTKQFSARYGMNHKRLRVYLRAEGHSVGRGRYYEINPQRDDELATGFYAWEKARQ
jgi:hypothetical protein